MRSGLISIGTNSTRALVAEYGGEKPRVLLHRWSGTRVGQGLKEHGSLDADAAARTLQAVGEYAEAVRRLTDDVQAIATSALRRASDRDDFAQRIETLIHTPLKIISGDEEARCAYEGAIAIVAHDAPDAIFAVADIGGGSTEIASGTRAGVREFVSCEIGAVRLTDAVPTLSGKTVRPCAEDLERARDLAAQALRPARLARGSDRLIIVGGSATTIVSVLRQSGEDFETAAIDRGQLTALIDRLAGMELEDRKTLAGMVPQRADIILAGAILIESLFRVAGKDDAEVSTSDLLLGYLLRHRGKGVA